MLTGKIGSLLFSRFPMLAADGSAGGGGGFVDESEKDDPNAPDDDEAIKNLLDTNEDDEGDLDEPEDEGEEAGEEDEPEEKEKKKPEKPESPAGLKTISMTQEDLDRLIADRLSRDRRVREDQDTQKADQQRRETEFKQQMEGRFNAKVKQLTDLGYTEDVAKATALEDVQNHVRMLRLENEVAESKKSAGKMSAMTRYNLEKNEKLSKNPIAAKYIKEIDSFSQDGTVVDFETAMNYVLGQKFASGELMKEIKSTTEQKTLANISKRQKTKVEGASQSGKTTAQAELTKTERILARNLGLTTKEYAEEKQKQVNKNKRKR